MEKCEKGKYNCALCPYRGCYHNEMDTVKMPNCPTLNEQERLNEILSKYEGECLKIAKVSAEVAVGRYGGKSRIEETIEFIRKMDYKKVGLVFCYALREEARLFANLVDVTLGTKTVLSPTSDEDLSEEEKNKVRFKLESLMCKMGSVEREKLGLTGFDSASVPMCNPIAQALFINEQETKLNIILGLCVGHDVLFNMFAKSPATVLAVKDRLYNHDPVKGFYDENGYCYKTLSEKRPMALKNKITK